MYKLTFDDKPEANTYIKWASQKGYKVEGPFREKLAKNAKKFDLNGKPKKYGYVVIRKRGGGPGAGGGDPLADIGKQKVGKRLRDMGYTGREIDKLASDEIRGILDKNISADSYYKGKQRMPKALVVSGTGAKQEPSLYSTRGAAEHERSVRLGAGHKDVFVRPYHKEGLAGGVAGYSVESTPPERGAKTVKLQSSEPKTKATEGAAKALRDSLKKSATQETIHERLVSDAEKLQIGSKAPPEPKKRGRPPKAKTITAKKKPLLKGAVAVEEKPSFASGRFAAPSELKRAAYRSSPEAISKAAKARGMGLSPEQIKQSQRRAQEVIREKATVIAGETSREQEAVRTVAEEWKARGETPPEQVDIMARAAERERSRREEAEREAKFAEAVGEPQTPGQKRRYEEVRALKREAEAPEKTRAKLIEDAAKARRAEDLRATREGKRASKAAKKTVARQESARKYVIKQYLKEGRQLPAGVSDYVAEKEKFQTEKAAAIGGKKTAREKATAEREKKYEKTFASYEEAAKWGKGQRDVSKEEDVAEMKTRAQRMAGVMGDKEMTPEQKRAEIGRLGKEFEEVAKAKQARGGVGAKRKSYVVRTKKGFKVITGTKEELETPTSLKAALAKEKRKFKKRKKLLEKPLREIKRAKKVLRTSARHGAKQLLRRSSSMNITRGKHPAIGNVSMEYRRARIATPILVPKSIAGQYTTGEDTRRRR